MEKLRASRLPRAMLFLLFATSVAGIVSCSSSPGQPVVTLKEKNQMYQVQVNKNKWSYSDKNKFDLNSDATFEFVHKNDDAYAMVISERITFDSVDKLMEFVVGNLYEGADSVEILDVDDRVVNGKEVSYLKTKAILNGLNLIYEGYYYTGKSGTIQFSAWTGENLFKEYEQDMIDLLNGLTIF